jgi:hypothetical protein
LNSSIGVQIPFPTPASRYWPVLVGVLLAGGCGIGIVGSTVEEVLALPDVEDAAGSDDVLVVTTIGVVVDGVAGVEEEF